VFALDRWQGTSTCSGRKVLQLQADVRTDAALRTRELLITEHLFGDSRARGLSGGWACKRHRLAGEEGRDDLFRSPLRHRDRTAAKGLPEARGAFASGELSIVQAAEIARHLHKSRELGTKLPISPAVRA